MSTPNKSSDAEIMVPLFAGAGAAWGTYQFVSRLPADSWVRSILGGLAHLTGQPATPRMEAIIAAALAFVTVLVVAIFLMDAMSRGSRRRAQIKTARAALAFEEQKDKLASKSRVNTTDRKTLDAIAKAQKRAEHPGQVTPGFVLACAGGFGIVFCIAAHFLL